MRKWFACLGILGLAATAATAQTIPGSISNYLQQVQEDDGRAETSWKIFYPTPAGEGYDVDFNTDGGAGMNVYGVAIQTYISQGSTSNWAYVAVCGDNLAIDGSGRTPDLGSPLSILNNPTGGTNLGYCTGFTTFDLPDVSTGSGGVHAAVAMLTGDTTTWLCADMFDSSGFNHTGPRHSFFTTDNYATPASYPFTNLNWMVRLAGSPATPNGGVFLVNGSTAASVAGGDTLALQFWSSDSSAATLYLQLLDLGGPLIPLPSLILSTGFSNFVAIPIQALGQLTGAAPCSAVGLTLTFRCYFMDNLDLKPNGKKKIKLSNGSTATFTGSKVCNPNVCFGIRDDGVMDGGIFNPRIWYGLGAGAGSKDAASVHHGFADNSTPFVNNLTAVETVTWDFCGGSCWQNVGIYPSNTVLDPSGNTPDLSSPIASVGGTSACYAGGAYTGTWGFPTQVYDTPDVAANTTTDYHTVMMYANNDSCLFVSLDNTGTDDDTGLDCADGTTGSNSFYTLDGFATTAVGGIGANLMERIDWN